MSGRPALRVAVASDQALVAESVRAALADRGFVPVVVRWPGGPAVPGPPQPRMAYDVGLLLSDLDRPSRVEAARTLISRVPTMWVVLTAAPRGPVWGAVLAAGALRVVADSARMERVERILRQAARGRGATVADESRRLQRAWSRAQVEQARLDARIESLTPREREVLTLLDRGETVASIAGLLGSSPSTVRSQLKAVLRKLGVSSQLAAVAAYRARSGGDEPDPPDDAEPELGGGSGQGRSDDRADDPLGDPLGGPLDDPLGGPRDGSADGPVGDRAEDSEGHWHLT